MSYVTLLAVRKTGEVEPYAEVKNNFGFAPLVWEHLARKYKTRTPTPHEYSILLDEPGLERLVKLFRTEALDASDNLLLGSTLDRVWIKRERLPRFVEVLERFYAEHVAPQQRVATMLSMAEVVKRLLAEDPELVGVAIDGCSAIPSFWTKRVPSKNKPGKFKDVALNIFTDRLASDGEPHFEVLDP